jgi:midasin
LDELNLAPSEVLEALNRLLDDNRELFVPETQEVVRPHPGFMIFGTQNPPGVYGGRKILSRAFRNRFLELHIDDIPNLEMRSILEQRCALAPSFCDIVISIMEDLQRRRHGSSLFAGKHGFITTRDLLRWANRRPGSKEELAEQGKYI